MAVAVALDVSDPVLVPVAVFEPDAVAVSDPVPVDV